MKMSRHNDINKILEGHTSSPSLQNQCFLYSPEAEEDKRDKIDNSNETDSIQQTKQDDEHFEDEIPTLDNMVISDDLHINYDVELEKLPSLEELVRLCNIEIISIRLIEEPVIEIAHASLLTNCFNEKGL